MPCKSQERRVRGLEAKGYGGIAACGCGRSALLEVHIVAQVVFFLILKHAVDALAAADVVVNACG